MMLRTKVKPAKIYAAKTPTKTQRKSPTTQMNVKPEETISLPNLPTPEPAQITIQPSIANIVLKDNDKECDMDVKDCSTTTDRKIPRSNFCLIYTFITLLLFFCIANALLTLYLYRSCGCQQASGSAKG